MTSLGEVAAQVLDAEGGDIIAVFSSSLYLQGNNGLCCIGNDTIPNGPVNAVTTLDHFNTMISAGSHWHYSDQCLTLADTLQIDTKHAAHWCAETPSITDIDHNRINEIATQIERVLFTQPPLSGSTVAAEINNKINHGEKQLANWVSSQESTTPDFIDELLGCGDGLTPGGDDLLLGAVVTLKHFGTEPVASKLADSIRQRAPARTNVISLAHLTAACDGQANELLTDLLCACTNGRETNHLPLISRLLNFGQSSGRYTLRGINTVLRQI